MNTDYRSRWDAIGIVASFACAIHCVLLPILFTTLTLCGIELLENVYLEMLTILVSMCAGSWALIKGFRKHQNKTLLILFFGGLVCMITGNLLASEYAEIACKLTGSMLIIIAHLKNVKHCKHK
jgi:uncharacterized membrane protein YfcA